jgi:hypothetical protein
LGLNDGAAPDDIRAARRFTTCELASTTRIVSRPLVRTGANASFQTDAMGTEPLAEGSMPTAATMGRPSYCSAAHAENFSKTDRSAWDPVLPAARATTRRGRPRRTSASNGLSIASATTAAHVTKALARSRSVCRNFDSCLCRTRRSPSYLDGVRRCYRRQAGSRKPFVGSEEATLLSSGVKHPGTSGEGTLPQGV